MTTLAYSIGAIVLVALVYVLGPSVLSAYARARGKRVVTCPETSFSGHRVSVEIDPRGAILSEVSGRRRAVSLRDCTRWPEKKDCGQECVAEIEASPNVCLLRSIFLAWYEGKSCALCGVVLRAPVGGKHQPALLGSDGRTAALMDFDVSRIDEVLATHRPVCWNCHVAESFRREHADLVIDRPRRTPILERGADDERRA